MALWSVKPQWKKSIIERQEWTKDSNILIVETGWRWGEFLVYTEDDTPPKLEAGVNMFDCGYESEMVETSDGCWDDQNYDDCDVEATEWLENFFDGGNSWLDLEEHGWIFTECEFIIDCDMEITRINDDGTEGESFVTGGDEDVTTEEIKLAPNAPWPFDKKD